MNRYLLDYTNHSIAISELTLFVLQIYLHVTYLTNDTNSLQPGIISYFAINTYTVETGYKNIFGSRKKCSYNRYVLIKGKINGGTYRNVSSENVLITGMFL